MFNRKNIIARGLLTCGILFTMTMAASTTCVSDSDCNDSFKVCSSSVCVHKGVFPFYLKEWFGLFFICLFAALSNVAGGGAAGVMIVLEIIAFNITTKEAIALDIFSNLVLGVVRHFQTLSEKHPEKDAVLTDYSLSVIIMPTVLVASYLGAVLNLFLPTLIIIVFASLTLLLLTI